MISFFFNALSFFRPVFSRKCPWLLFSMVIIGFIGADEMAGITSMCRHWGLGASGYNALLHFFRSGAWSLAMLICYWHSFVLSLNVTVMSAEHAVLAGDHTYVPKDGRRMPGV
ncbi:MAG: transposase, partial [Pseudoalteromonas sp.]|nr:transposase [Pseudoalteromonas sp.]